MTKKIDLAEPEGRCSSVTNAIRMLKLFSDESHELGIVELARSLDVAKSTASRLAGTLVESGMLECNPESGKYRLALAVFELGALVRRKMNLSQEAKPVLVSLRDKTGESVRLAVLRSADIVYINSLLGFHPDQTVSEIGLRKPALASVEGRVLMAFQDIQVIDELAKNQAAVLPETVKVTALLKEDLDRIRHRGYLCDEEESAIGLSSVTAPVRDHSGNVVAAISVAGAAQRLHRQALAAVARNAVEAASQISTRLGFADRRMRDCSRA